jgi:hypothetical protein
MSAWRWRSRIEGRALKTASLRHPAHFERPAVFVAPAHAQRSRSRGKPVVVVDRGLTRAALLRVCYIGAVREGCRLAHPGPRLTFFSAPPQIAGERDHNRFDFLDLTTLSSHLDPSSDALLALRSEPSVRDPQGAMTAAPPGGTEYRSMVE